MRNLLLVLLWIGIASCTTHKNSTSTSSTNEALRVFAEQAALTYLDEADTLVTARLQQLPDTLNHFLFNCAKENRTAADKYAFLLVLRLAEEFYTVNNSDYDFCDYQNNGIIELVRQRMGVAYDPVGCSFFKTYDVYLWVKANQEEFKDYSPLMNQLKKLDKLVSK